MPVQLWRLGFAALWHPELMLAGALIIAAYLWAVRRGSRSGHVTETMRITSFVLGVAVLYLGVGTPIDAVGDHFLFSGHMIEHSIIGFFSPPLLLLGLPAWMVRRLLGRRLIRVMAFLTRPLTAMLLFNIAMSGFFLPLFVRLSLQSDPMHFVEHAVIFVTALIMWWPVISPLPELSRLSPPGKLLYLFLDMLVMLPATAAVLWSLTPLYPGYLHTTQLFGLTPLQDQEAGGMIMNLAGTAAYGIAGLFIFLGWARREAVREQVSTFTVYRSGEQEPVVVHRHPTPPTDDRSRRSAH